MGAIGIGGENPPYILGIEPSSRDVLPLHRRSRRTFQLRYFSSVHNCALPASELEAGFQPIPNQHHASSDNRDQRIDPTRCQLPATHHQSEGPRIASVYMSSLGGTSA